LEQLSITDIASFVRLQLCRRYPAFQAGRGERKVREILEQFRTLADPVYQEVGLRSEVAVEDLLKRHNLRPAPGLLEESTWPRWLEEVGRAVPGGALYAREVEISGQVGVFSLEGRMDLVLLHWEDGAPKVRVLELKASRRNRSHHYVQLALYASLVKGMPPIWKGQLVEVDYLVVRVDPGTMAPEDPLRSPTREEKKLLEQAIQDVEDLLKKGGLVEEILSGPDPFQIPYTLNARCDACGYNTVCLREAAERRDLERATRPPFYVRKVGGLVLISYRERAGFTETHWDGEARELRGIVYAEATGEVVSRPFHRFFNLGDPRCPFSPDRLLVPGDLLARKVDGRLLQVFAFQGRPWFASRGSPLLSGVEEASRRKAWTHDHDTLVHRAFEALGPVTLLFEVVDPERPVMELPEAAAVVLLAVRHIPTGRYWFPGASPELDALLGDLSLPRLSYRPAGEGTLGGLHRAVREEQGREGYVLWLAEGDFVKIWTYAALVCSAHNGLKSRLSLPVISLRRHW